MGITGKSRRVGVQGMGGIGKTVLATALARDEEVRQAFPDGVFWLTFGQTPQILTWQSYLASALGEKQAAFTEVGVAKARLRELFAEKACLLILDDIWRLDDATAFDVLGERCQMLITTRDGAIVTGLGGEKYQLAVLGKQQALELLANWANQPEILQPSPHNDVTLQVARECGYLPLALAMVGAMMRGKPANRWQNILEKLHSADLEKIKQQFPNYPYPNLLKAIQVSVDDLDEDCQQRYLDFALFPEDTPIPEAVLQTFWQPLGLDEFDTQDVIDELVSKSLALRDEAGNLRLHKLQFDYVRKQHLTLAIEETIVAYNVLLTVLPDEASIGEELEINVYFGSYSTDKNAYLLEISYSKTIGSELNIILTAPGFQFNGNNTTSLLLDYNTANINQRATFHLIALRPGHTKIKAELYCGETYKTTLEAEVEVTPFVQTELRPLIAARSRPVPQPDIILQVRTTWNADISVCTFNYHIDSYQPRLLFADDVDYNSQSLSNTWVERSHSLLKTTLEEAASSVTEDFRSRLVSLGRYLFQSLLPEELQNTFRTIASFNQPFTLLILADQDAWFPWELLHDGQKFLGDRFIIGRWLWELEKSRPYEFPVGAVNVAHYASVEQPELWAELLQSSGAPPPISMQAGIFNDISLFESIRGLHLIRYGQSVDTTNRQDAPVRVNSSSDIQDIEREMQPAKLSLRRNHPLVSLSYLNAGQPELTALEQTWASTFIRAGCSAFVGSLWAVQPNVEAAFVSAFYNSIWAGQTLSVAFQTARRLAKTVVPESLDWLAYVLFGDPMARPYRPVQGQGYAVVEPIGQEIDDPVSPGSTIRFRVSLRRTPPVWYENRLMEVALDLSFDDLRVFIVTSGLQVTPGDSILMTRTATGDYLGWFTLTVPTEMESRSILVQVYFEDGIEPVHNLRFALNIVKQDGEAQ
ncbi:hypothetical protein H6G33_24760 [Calothrix sp. FACHB-1219]|uniref:NB-ARC domain-containing protein n=1 Tax=unclassified Calothrix TaxID=2619626 RepID=UPI0016873ACC|nr:NB-ARC domain-containing protein [Calothrix sp. FACHB-168]MBD2205557.1 hypothetical protein [Calothrix sp. FACHB-168]MBD2220220.1 hypothetical protein [Calothrix sp. FACHB-1219]